MEKKERKNLNILKSQKKVKSNFYLNNDVVGVSKKLLGKKIFTKIDNKNITAGIITEVEAYAGTTDKASHAYNGRRTRRTRPMYEKGGIAYVYMCYGMHYLLNVVTNKKDIPRG